MNSIKISLVKYEFKRIIAIRKYQKKPCNRILSTKYDIAGDWITLGDEKRYE
ncbi:MAG TPA: hypothetical protein VJJ52_00965 [Candidatus Nanoarchaeia archaeon]|nr:hypothetical protein [Candidatus Nanoarchaeia archaeon]